MQALLNTKDPSVVEPILAFAKTPQGAWINQDQVLLAFKDARLVQDLLDRLKAGDERARATAARELAEYKDERIVPALVETLKDEASSVQYSAAGALGKLGQASAAPALMAMLDYNPGAAALALGDLHQVNAVTRLLALLADPKLPNRKEIVAGITKMPGPQAAEALSSFVEQTPLRDCDLDIELARALASLTGPHVIAALQRINFDGSKKDGCFMARMAASQALSERGARPFPDEK